ncbi:hypothetical protein LINPERPRIM_LOCUS28513 [Linum perenne]
MIAERLPRRELLAFWPVKSYDTQNRQDPAISTRWCWLSSFLLGDYWLRDAHGSRVKELGCCSSSTLTGDYQEVITSCNSIVGFIVRRIACVLGCICKVAVSFR